MTICRLTLTDSESDQWPNSTHKGEVIARAEDERQARKLINNRFGLVPELVTCETIDDWGGETDGPAEILYPVDHAVTDRRREAGYLRALAYQAEHQTTDLQALGGRIHEHLLSQACAIAKQRAQVDTSLNYWVNEVKKPGERDLLIKIAPGLRKIADELERQATVPS